MIEREGELIQEYLGEKAESLLKSHGFRADGKRLSSNKEIGSENVDGIRQEESPASGQENLTIEKNLKSTEINYFDINKEQDPKIGRGSIAEDEIMKAIEDLNAGKGKELQIDLSELHETFEDPESVLANISLDDVLAKKQKESNREKDSPSKEKKEYVKNTVSHLESGENTPYILNAACVEKILILVLAFLLHNGLISSTGQVIFFIDGETSLRLAIQSLFLDLLPFKIILDWFHLEKKCKERLSMGMKGKCIRNKVLGHITPLLWHGKVEAAITYLQGLNKGDIKNQDEIKRLIGYFERNRDFIPCYALRQKLGLRVSSNRVEKANDLVVSSRQKHNGMSWSTSGSTGLATITSMHLNNEQANWLLDHEITFQFKNSPEKAAA